MSKAIRVDPDVKRMLDIERRPNERSYNQAIMRILAEGVWRPRHLAFLKKKYEQG